MSLTAFWRRLRDRCPHRLCCELPKRQIGVAMLCADCGEGWLEMARPIPVGTYDEAKQIAGAARAEARQRARRHVEAKAVRVPVLDNVVSIRRKERA